MEDVGELVAQTAERGDDLIPLPGQFRELLRPFVQSGGRRGLSLFAPLLGLLVGLVAARGGLGAGALAGPLGLDAGLGQLLPDGGPLLFELGPAVLLLGLSAADDGGRGFLRLL
jgi:hypothetical protein